MVLGDDRHLRCRTSISALLMIILFAVDPRLAADRRLTCRLWQDPIGWLATSTMPAIFAGRCCWRGCWHASPARRWLEVLRQDYIRTAHAKGSAAPPGRTEARAGQRADPPSPRFVGIIISLLISGAVVTETLFFASRHRPIG